MTEGSDPERLAPPILLIFYCGGSGLIPHLETAGMTHSELLPAYIAGLWKVQQY